MSPMAYIYILGKDGLALLCLWVRLRANQPNRTRFLPLHVVFCANTSLKPMFSFSLSKFA